MGDKSNPMRQLTRALKRTKLPGGKKTPNPVCVFCHRSGPGVEFAIFKPRFPPFGTACVDCETTLAPGTTVPAAPGTFR